ncbi:hypothetical protein F5Y16DRAFT_363790 [Xylariaceae sp. FL0255]|nr:hypothetical protein F5Y16DRAFT_363790 [Xylariaceae sp. FL0255]
MVKVDILVGFALLRSPTITCCSLAQDLSPGQDQLYAANTAADLVRVQGAAAAPLIGVLDEVAIRQYQFSER